MKIDLSDLKVDDTLFSTNDGHLTIKNITDVIHTNIFKTYYKDGKHYFDDHHPSLFHSLDECIEYFQSVKTKQEKEKKMENEQVKLDEQAKQDCPDHKNLGQEETNEEPTQERKSVSEEDLNRVTYLVHHALAGCLHGMADYYMNVSGDYKKEDQIKIRLAVTQGVSYLMSNELTNIPEENFEERKQDMERLIKEAVDTKRKIIEDHEKINKELAEAIKKMNEVASKIRQ